ncbi:GntR family transcriptional regulator / MocR family aminotransferase [Polaromonas sp. OV174]|uniref:MocR-like pyridoxine biosynthesis transcription factor PdxR n=1 Tax=Polaromonas sp. OV174 TaxID=1855300 RepID=UPI0008F07A50|nr:PLP-dependent aminotransferase family protein [Polaromonas sp. OV174]SFC74612.1 GntR family transcriptional regulator / MocR family aminotransferase [Polaromonas sp. OV174]
MNVRKTYALALPLAPRQPDEAKQAWVYRTIRELILDGSLPTQSRLPSTRDLAKSWQVSRGIVESAYERLVMEGYAASRTGIGTHVSGAPPDSFFRSTQPAPGGSASRPAGELRPDEEREHALGLRYGQPFLGRLADPAQFPLDRWRRIMSDRLQRMDAQTLAEDDPAGHLPLRKEIAKYLGSARGLRCDAAAIIVVTGIRHAVDLTARLLAADSEVLIEDPGYQAAYELFKSQGANVVPVPVDRDGISMQQVRSSKRATLVYVTPAHQSPLGVSMSERRRTELLEWAADRKAWILEDDYDSEINYAGAPMRALKGIDAADRVIHCGSFNKTLFPSLRIGYMVVPKPLIQPFLRLRALTGRANSVLDQLTLAAFLQSGLFGAHLRAVRMVYLKRRDIVIEVLRCHLGPSLRLSGAHAGFHFLLWLPEGVTESALRSQAVANGIQLHGLADYCHRARLEPGVLIGFTATEEAELERAATTLAQLIVQQQQTAMDSRGFS